MLDQFYGELITFQENKILKKIAEKKKKEKESFAKAKKRRKK